MPLITNFTDELRSKFGFYIRGNIADINQTIELTLKTINLDGDFCEVGSFIGGCCALMGDICTKYNKNKKIYLFDSFEGIPYPTQEDDEIPGNPEGVTRTGELKSTGVSVASLEWVEKTLSVSSYSKENFIIIKGWVQDTLPENNLGPIAFLRIDVDLYIPTVLSLEYLYDKVVKGGIILVHDYYTLAGCKQAVDEFVKKHPEIKFDSRIEGTSGISWEKNE
jgi:hypothetical protein